MIPGRGVSLQGLLDEAEASQGEIAEAVATPQQQQQQQQGRRDSLGAPPSTPAPARRESFSLASMLKKQKASILLHFVRTLSAARPPVTLKICLDKSENPADRKNGRLIISVICEANADVRSYATRVSVRHALHRVRHSAIFHQQLLSSRPLLRAHVGVPRCRLLSVAHRESRSSWEDT